MNIPGQALYEGQWKSDKFEGRGKIFYTSGDFYHGQVNRSTFSCSIHYLIQINQNFAQICKFANKYWFFNISNR